MRLISLLVGLLVLAFLVYFLRGQETGGNDPSTYRDMERSVSEVQVQLDEQLARQAGQLSEVDAVGRVEPQGRVQP